MSQTLQEQVLSFLLFALQLPSELMQSEKEKNLTHHFFPWQQHATYMHRIRYTKSAKYKAHLFKITLLKSD